MKHILYILSEISVLLLLASPALAAELGTARTAGEVLELLKNAKDGDSIRIQGEVDMSGITLSSSAQVTFTSGKRTATIYNLSLRDSNITLRHLDIVGTLSVSGNSSLILTDKTTVEGAPGKDALVFSGNGTLIVEKGCEVTGGSSAEQGGSAILIDHTDGEFYAGLEGTLTGGDGETAGSGLTVSHLSGDGALLVDGSVNGGNGNSIGGNALNLYDLSDNAFVSVSGELNGGNGNIGGAGAQVVSLSDIAYVGMEGNITGGDGMAHGGNAVLLMNASGASAVSVSGSLSGGQVEADDGEPGVSLLVPDDSASHAIIDDCLLQDGGHAALEHENVLPEITSSVQQVTMLEPTPAPSPAAEAEEETAVTDEPVTEETVAAAEPVTEEIAAADEPVTEETVAADEPIAEETDSENKPAADPAEQHEETVQKEDSETESDAIAEETAPSDEPEDPGSSSGPDHSESSSPVEPEAPPEEEVHIQPAEDPSSEPEAKQES